MSVPEPDISLHFPIKAQGFESISEESDSTPQAIEPLRLPVRQNFSSNLIGLVIFSVRGAKVAAIKVIGTGQGPSWAGME
ncbi:hypothetical protein [Bradyrhizobium sp.]|uniref:hypothetical protein n=1 Tax=Bradyrhizobium sp. TaxID=376 RepID=UPI003C758D2C